MESNTSNASGSPGALDETDAAAAPAEGETEAERKERLARELDAMKPLTADEILGTDDLPTEWCPVKEWGGKVLVRALTGRERDVFEGSIVKQRGKVRETNVDNIRAKLCQLTMIDPTDTETAVSKRKPLFSGKQVDQLGKKSAAALDRVYDVAARLSGLSNADVEELAGNSGAAVGGGSSSS